jgi:hypothetical protein
MSALLIWPRFHRRRGRPPCACWRRRPGRRCSGLHLQQDDDAVPGAAGDFGRGHVGRTGPIRPLTRRSTESGRHCHHLPLLAVIVPLSIYFGSKRQNRRPPKRCAGGGRALARRGGAGLWSAYRHGRAVLVEATWPGPAPSLAQLRRRHDMPSRTVTAPASEKTII